MIYFPFSPPPPPPFSLPPSSASYLHLKWGQVRSSKVKSCGQSLDKKPFDMKSLKSPGWTQTVHYLSLLSYEACYYHVY